MVSVVWSSQVLIAPDLVRGSLETSSTAYCGTMPAINSVRVFISGVASIVTEPKDIETLHTVAGLIFFNLFTFKIFIIA